MSTPRRFTLDDVVATSLLTALTVVTALGLSRVFTDWEYLRPVLTVALVVHLVCFLLRQVRLPGVVALVLAAIVLAEVLCLVFYRSSMRYGLPTGTTWQYIRLDLRLVWAQFPTAVAPVPSTSPFAMVAALALGSVALAADAFAFRALGRAEALVPSAVVFIFTAALGIDRNRVVLTGAWLATAVAAVAVLRALHGSTGDGWLGRRRAATPSTLPAAAACAAVCALGAVLIGPLLPGAGQAPIIDARQTVDDDGAVLSPLVDIRARLVNRSDVEMFTVDAAIGRYWRLSGLSDFDGTTWTLTDADLVDTAGSFNDPAGPVQILQQYVVVGRLGGRLVPSAYEPVQVAQPGIGWQDETGSLLLADRPLARGQTFNIAANIALPPPEVLAAATSSSPPADDLFALPADFPVEVAQLARDVTADAATPYAQALALQSYFRDNFVYDIDVQRGHSDSAIVSFLRERRGYCEQFSATFAAMGRAVGLPTRVAVGFTSGELRSDGSYHVLGRHAHAWPEVWFDGIGWVLFEPTPGRGAPGSEAVTGVAAAQDTGDAATDQPASVTTTPPTTVRPTGTTVPNRPSTTTTVPTLPQAGSGNDGDGPGVGTWMLLGLALCGAWMVLMPTMVRRFTRVGDTPSEQVVSAWHGAVGAVVAAGAQPPGGATPLEFARQAGASLDIDTRPLDELARFVTRAIYSPAGVAEPTALRAAVLRTQVVEACDDTMPLLRRWRCRIDPRVVRQRLVGTGRVSAKRRSPDAGAASPTPA
jgi:transglutaminase-like putative cysteine protease